jgi:hypothetical protein
MDLHQLRNIFHRAIRHSCTAGALVGALSCAAEQKDPVTPLANPTSTPTTKEASTAPASTPTSLAQSLPTDLPEIPLKDPDDMDRNRPRYPQPAYGFEKYNCRDGEAKTLSGVTPQKAPDYMELVAYGDSTGEACKTAKDATKCQESLKKAKSKNDRALLVTQGDEVLVVTKKNVKKFLGGADNAQEAALIVHLNGIDVCGEGATIQTDMSDKFKFAINGRTCTNEMNYGVEVSKAGDYKLIGQGEGSFCRGRRPEGLCEPEKIQMTNAGEFFAEAAWQEAVSVPAFRDLARDLLLLNAPAHLIEAARSFADDEIRHAEQMTALAARFGATVSVPEVRETTPKNLLALAIENEREGCINETFAALLAWHQAETAADPEVRSELRKIAEDETRHSQLSFEIREWALSQLAPSERSFIQETRQQTIARLRTKIEVLPEDTATMVGWPSLGRSLQLLRQLEQNLWS